MSRSTDAADGHAPCDPTAPLVVYDLDGVVTRHDSFTALVLRRLGHCPVRLLLALPHALALAVRRSPEARQALTRTVSRIALRGMDLDRYALLADALGERIGASPGWIRGEVVEDMLRRRRRGETIVVATATEGRLATAILRAAGAPYDILSASSLAEVRGGLAFDDHRVGARKLTALREEGVAIGDALFLTDSTTDLPTALAARRVRLVGASRRTRRSFADAGIVLIED